MPLDLTYLGHSGFLLSDGTYTLCIDPFLTDNDAAVHKPDDVKCDTVAFTHGHFDHFNDDGIAIAKNNKAMVIAGFELMMYCKQKEGIAEDRLQPLNPGGRVTTTFGWMEAVPAIHSSSVNGQYMGVPMGLILRMGGVTVYHSSDTALYSDMKLIGELHDIDLALICAGDAVTMGPRSAVLAAQWVKAKRVVPHHYATFPFLTGDPAEVQVDGIDTTVMKPGETMHVSG